MIRSLIHLLPGIEREFDSGQRVHGGFASTRSAAMRGERRRERTGRRVRDSAHRIASRVDAPALTDTPWGILINKTGDTMGTLTSFSMTAMPRTPSSPAPESASHVEASRETATERGPSGALADIPGPRPPAREG